MLSNPPVKNLLNNSRFYILLFAVLLSIFAACLLRVQIPSEQLFYIRLEQVFGLSSLIFLYIALLISPLQKIIGGREWIYDLIFARRAIGVTAAYFAVLHTGVAVWGQIGGIGNLSSLPDTFLRSLIFGIIALIILLLMAATSFDKVIVRMTYRHWKWLHRLIYIGSVLIILHVWIIGSHAAYGWMQLIGFIALAIFFGLDSWRIVSTSTKRSTELKSKDYAITLTICLWVFWLLVLLAMPRFVQNYHSGHQHSNTEKGNTHQHE